MITKIRNEEQYQQVLKMIETFIDVATRQGGFHTLSKKENTELEKLSLLAEAYEDQTLRIMPLPVTIEAAVHSKMQELNITQQKLAEILGLGAPKLSRILKGKRAPDVSFLKAVHEKLGIDGNFILERV